MAKPSSIEVAFEAAGKQYRLRFQALAFSDLEDHYGAGIDALVERLDQSARIRDVAAWLWAGLQFHHEGLTKREALRLVDELGVGQAFELVRKALGAALPEPKAGAAEGAPADPPPGPSTAT